FPLQSSWCGGISLIWMIRASIDFRASMEQDRKMRAVALVGASDLQLSIDPFDKRPNNRHSQSFADGRIKSFRQRRTIVGDRKRIAHSGIRFQPDRDPA